MTAIRAARGALALLLGLALCELALRGALLGAELVAGRPIEAQFAGLATLGDDPDQLRVYGSFREARSNRGDFGVEVSGAAPAAAFALLVASAPEAEHRPLLRGRIGPDGTGRLSLAGLARDSTAPEGRVVRVRAMCALLRDETGGGILRFTRPTELVFE